MVEVVSDAELQQLWGQYGSILSSYTVLAPADVRESSRTYWTEMQDGLRQIKAQKSYLDSFMCANDAVFYQLEALEKVKQTLALFDPAVRWAYVTHGKEIKNKMEIAEREAQKERENSPLYRKLRGDNKDP